MFIAQAYRAWRWKYLPVFYICLFVLGQPASSFVVPFNPDKGFVLGCSGVQVAQRKSNPFCEGEKRLCHLTGYMKMWLVFDVYLCLSSCLCLSDCTSPLAVFAETTSLCEWVDVVIRLGPCWYYVGWQPVLSSTYSCESERPWPGFKVTVVLESSAVCWVSATRIISVPILIKTLNKTYQEGDVSLELYRV